MRSPNDMAKASAKAKIKAGVDKFKNCLDDTMTIRPEDLERAMKLIDELVPIPFPVVGAIAAFGGAKVLRVTHPMLYEDDMPPWERVSLDNMLFVLFLDEFCHMAKKYGGIYENYLP